jgi:putative colanic acid biosysnthesis UDP-glucose lipid carrier transferase
MSLFLRAAFFLGDLIFLNLSIVLSYGFFHVRLIGQERINGVYLFIFSNLAWLFLIVVSNPYNFSKTWGISKIFKSQSSFIFIHLLVVASLIFFFKKSYAPFQIGLMYLLFFPTFFVWKISLLYIVNVFRRKNSPAKNFIIIGQGDLAKEVRRYFLVHRELQYRFLGLFGDRESIPHDEIKNFCRQNKIQEIYFCLPNTASQDIKKLIEFGLDTLIRVKLVADRPFAQESLELEQDDQIPVISITTIPLDDIKNQLVKRIFDFLFSLAVTVTILSWLVPIMALGIKLDSRGPVFFRQRRTGLNNKPFNCLKFRTMKINQEADTKQATMNDSRITRFGSFLRKSSLDEMPQFFNVLVGEMSLIGPRPHPIKLNERFNSSIGRLMSRHYVKPGITGLAQSMGYRGETRDLSDMRNRVKLDRFYIENWSFLLDIKIIIRTVISLIRGSEKAY